jgi:hypothetical protein
MRNDIANELKNCDPCTRFTVVKSGFHPAQYITASGPGVHFQMDTSVHLPETPEGHTVLLVLIDVFTGFVVLRALKNSRAETVAAALWDIFSLIGIPQILQSDNGSEFVNDVMRTLIKLNGVEHRFISAYNPRADGKVERAIGSVTMIIKKLLNGTSMHWNLFVNFAQLSFNNKISDLTGSSPFSLMFGRELNPIKDYTQGEMPEIIDLADWQEHQKKILSLIFPAVSERIKSKKDKLAKEMDSHRKLLLPDAFPAGSTVMLKDTDRKNMFEPKYVGPYYIARRARNGAYVLKDGEGDLLDRHVPADQLKFICKGKRAVDKEKPTYSVRQILDHKGSPGSFSYFVDWEGYGEEDRSWVKEKEFLDQDIIHQYWKRMKNRQEENKYE